MISYLVLPLLILKSFNEIVCLIGYYDPIEISCFDDEGFPARSSIRSVDIDIYWVLIELSYLNLLPVFRILDIRYCYISFSFYSFDFKSPSLSFCFKFDKSMPIFEDFLNMKVFLLFEPLSFCLRIAVGRHHFGFYIINTIQYIQMFA